MKKIIKIAKTNNEQRGMKLKLLYSRKLKVVISIVKDDIRPIIIQVIDLTTLLLHPA